MHAFLIIGGTATLRSAEISRRLAERGISPFDVTSPSDPEPTIGVAEIRTFIKNLSLAPQQGNATAGVISKAEALTPEAQQTLLKTIEEPPPSAVILLGAQNATDLLPTIVSRCVVVPTQSDGAAPDEADPERIRDQITGLLSSTPGAVVTGLSAVGKTRDDLLQWLDRAIHVLRSDTVGAPPPRGFAADRSQKIYLLHALLRIKQYIPNNVNLSLLIEHALLNAASRK